MWKTDPVVMMPHRLLSFVAYEWPIVWNILYQKWARKFTRVWNWFPYNIKYAHCTAQVLKCLCFTRSRTGFDFMAYVDKTCINYRELVHMFGGHLCEFPVPRAKAYLRYQVVCHVASFIAWFIIFFSEKIERNFLHESNWSCSFAKTYSEKGITY